MTATKEAFIGFLLAMPFVALNFAVVFQSTPVLSFLRPQGSTSVFEIVVLFALIALVFVGGIVALLPMLKKNMFGQRRFYIVNAIVGISLLAISASLIYGLGEDVYRCNILQIPNCD